MEENNNSLILFGDVNLSYMGTKVTLPTRRLRLFQGKWFSHFPLFVLLMVGKQCSQGGQYFPSVRKNSHIFLSNPLNPFFSPPIIHHLISALIFSFSNFSCDETNKGKLFFNCVFSWKLFLEWNFLLKQKLSRNVTKFSKPPPYFTPLSFSSFQAWPSMIVLALALDGFDVEFWLVAKSWV